VLAFAVHFALAQRFAFRVPVLLQREEKSLYLSLGLTGNFNLKYCRFDQESGFEETNSSIPGQLPECIDNLRHFRNDFSCSNHLGPNSVPHATARLPTQACEDQEHCT
jgi:hypothetical protein